MILALHRLPAALLISFHPKYINYLNASNIPSRVSITQVFLPCKGISVKKTLIAVGLLVLAFSPAQAQKITGAGATFRIQFILSGLANTARPIPVLKSITSRLVPAAASAR